MGIEREPPVIEPRHGRRTRRALEDRAHPRDQLARAEGFGDVIVGAEFEPEDAVDLVVAGGQEQDRHLGARTDPAAGLEPVHLGQADVEHDQIGRLARGMDQRLRAIGGGDHGMTRPFEREPHQIAQPGIGGPSGRCSQTSASTSPPIRKRSDSACR